MMRHHVIEPGNQTKSGQLGEEVGVVTKIFMVFQDPHVRSFVKSASGPLVSDICFRNVDVQGITIHQEEKGDLHQITHDGTYRIYGARVKKDMHYSIPALHPRYPFGGFLGVPMTRNFSFRFSEKFFRKYLGKRQKVIEKAISWVPLDVQWLVCTYDHMLGRKKHGVSVQIFLSYLPKPPPEKWSSFSDDEDDGYLFN
jgi:hypothetical protein